MLHTLCIKQPNNETIPLIQTMDIFEQSDFIKEKQIWKYNSIFRMLYKSHTEKWFSAVIMCLHAHLQCTEKKIIPITFKFILQGKCNILINYALSYLNLIRRKQITIMYATSCQKTFMPLIDFEHVKNPKQFWNLKLRKSNVNVNERNTVSSMSPTPSITLYGTCFRSLMNAFFSLLLKDR